MLWLLTSIYNYTHFNQSINYLAGSTSLILFFNRLSLRFMPSLLRGGDDGLRLILVDVTLPISFTFSSSISSSEPPTNVLLLGMITVVVPGARAPTGAPSDSSRPNLTPSE